MIIVANAREALPSVLSFIYNSTNLALYILIFLLSASQSVLLSLFSFLGNKQSIYIYILFTFFNIFKIIKNCLKKFQQTMTTHSVSWSFSYFIKFLYLIYYFYVFIHIYLNHIISN